MNRSGLEGGLNEEIRSVPSLILLFFFMGAYFYVSSTSLCIGQCLCFNLGTSIQKLLSPSTQLLEQKSSNYLFIDLPQAAPCRLFVGLMCSYPSVLTTNVPISGKPTLTNFPKWPLPVMCGILTLISSFIAFITISNYLVYTCLLVNCFLLLLLKID